MEGCWNRYATTKCINCGLLGHTSKRCQYPVSSFGIICHRYNNQRQKYEYLFVQRKDSLTYIEFVRGMFAAENSRYIIILLSNMARYEKERLMTETFDVIWEQLWGDNTHYHRHTHYMECKNRFERLRNGFPLTTNDGATVLVAEYSLAWLIQQSDDIYEETEWEFPKGRRHHMGSGVRESDLDCAKREFQEETGIDSNALILYPLIRPMDEVFTGVNRIRYRHLYYIATLIPGVNYHLDMQNKKQTCEIKNIMWFTYKEAKKRLRLLNVERKALLGRLDKFLVNKRKAAKLQSI